MHADHSRTGEIVESVLPYSRYLQRLLAGEPGLREDLVLGLPHPFAREEMEDFLEAHAEEARTEEGLDRVLRHLRKRVMLRLIVRDLVGTADLEEVMACMTHLAEVLIDFALVRHHAWLADPDRYGQPRGAVDGMPQEMVVVAMGKLGGGELNVSSDVDLIFVYPEDGETDGARRISNHDFFARLGRRLIASLNDLTSDGYVFRVDMRLRPHGESGPLAVSFAMLEDYFISHGREWERYAWIKGRVVAGPDVEGGTLMERIAQPFVFRKYLDFGAYESMRGLYAQIRREVARREMRGNIKLGPGGIREIEFIAQVFQLIRGGRDADLRVRPTLAVLEQLRIKRQLPESAVAQLATAYCFLRALEHRLQYLDDQQIQSLPDDANDQGLIAAAMGFSELGNFQRALECHRRNVTLHFEQIFATPLETPASDSVAWLWQDQDGRAPGGEDARTWLARMGFSDPDRVLDRLRAFRASVRYRQLPRSSAKRVDALVPAVIEAAAGFPAADATLERLLLLLESVSRRAAYLALLREYPQALDRVARLVSASRWAGDYLCRHPILLDELLGTEDAGQAPDALASGKRLMRQLESAGAAAEDDTEQKMDVLRHFQHAEVFRLLARDVAGLLPLETLSDRLSDLADLMLDTVLRLAWAGLRRRHRDVPAFGVIGYGKLGGKELGYASDLDIIFLYDDAHPDAQEIYARLCQRMNSWLTSRTSAGLLYETDLRLRPNGGSGLLVSSIEAFDQYQKHQAWVWEHQALTRARFVAGDEGVRRAFDATRDAVLSRRRDPALLAAEILRMRGKIREAHPNPTRLFDVKHDRGGIIDIEFIVQYLVLGHACEHPRLLGNIGNIGLLRTTGELGLIPRDAAQRVLDAYREFRRIQHRIRLDGEPAVAGESRVGNVSPSSVRVESAGLKREIEAVLDLWEAVFGTRWPA